MTAWRFLDFSSRPVYASIRKSQLVVRGNDADVVESIPVTDIFSYVVSNRQSTFSTAALASLTEAGAVGVFLGKNYAPTGTLLPTSSHNSVGVRVRNQLGLTVPRKKQLRKALIRAKISAQAKACDDFAAQSTLRAIEKSVQSGDPDNREAYAARVYWSAWIHNGNFKRRQDSLDPRNSALNYGYSVLRSAVARSVAASGLLPAVGIWHSNAANPMCLVDDLIEPLRPFVDVIVRDVDLSEHLTPEDKRRIASVLYVEVKIGDQQSPLFQAVPEYVFSVAENFGDASFKLQIPKTNSYDRVLEV